MNSLIVMIGIPGSGKSTYAKKLIEQHHDWKYVSRDEVRYQYVSDQEHYFDHEGDVYKEFCNRISMHLINGDTVIADATHLNIKSRKRLISSLDIKPDKIIYVVMGTSFEECKKRNAERTGIIRVPDKNLFQMRNAFQNPNPVVEDYDQVAYVK